MIRAFYGLKENPFSPRQLKLLPQQQEIYEILRVHCQQGGLCVIAGNPASVAGDDDCDGLRLWHGRRIPT